MNLPETLRLESTGTIRAQNSVPKVKMEILLGGADDDDSKVKCETEFAMKIDTPDEMEGNRSVDSKCSV